MPDDSIKRSRGRAKVPPPAQSTAKAASGVVKTLSDDQVEALVAVTGATIVKGSKKDITKDKVQHKVDTYDVTIQITKTINSTQLAAAADAAVAIQEVATSKELEGIAELVSKAAEKSTIVKSLKVLNDRLQPAKAASIKI